MNRHPVILDQLGALLPSGGRRPETRLATELRLGIAGREQLAAPPARHHPPRGSRNA